MDLKEIFKILDREHVATSSTLKSTCLALRRSDINTIEELVDAYRNNHEVLEHIRNIGPKRMEVIDRVIEIYEQSYKDK